MLTALQEICKPVFQRKMDIDKIRISQSFLKMIKILKAKLIPQYQKMNLKKHICNI